MFCSEGDDDSSSSVVIVPAHVPHGWKNQQDGDAAWWKAIDDEIDREVEDYAERITRVTETF